MITFSIPRGSSPFPKKERFGQFQRNGNKLQAFWPHRPPPAGWGHVDDCLRWNLSGHYVFCNTCSGQSPQKGSGWQSRDASWGVIRKTDRAKSMGGFPTTFDPPSRPDLISILSCSLSGCSQRFLILTSVIFSFSLLAPTPPQHHPFTVCSISFRSLLFSPLRYGCL